MKIRTLLVPLLLLTSFASTAFAGDLSIISEGGNVTFQISHDGKTWKTVQIHPCRYVNPYKNIGNRCDGIFDFNTNSNKEAVVRFYSRTRDEELRTYRLKSGNCHAFKWRPLGHGLDLFLGCDRDHENGQNWGN